MNNNEIEELKTQKKVAEKIKKSLETNRKTSLDTAHTELINHSTSYEFIIKNYILELIIDAKKTQIPYFSNVSVHHDYRSKGIGKLIFQYAVEECKQKYKQMLLDVLANNPAAIKTYEACGFEIENYKSPGFVVPNGIDVDEFSMIADFSISDNKKR